MARLGNLDYEAAAKSDIVPEGEFEAQIVKSEIVPTKAGTGKRLALVFEVTVNGSKRQHWHYLNVVNPNPEAVRISTRELLSIAKAIDVPVPVVDSEDLHHKPMMVTVKHKTDDYGEKAELKKFAPWRARPRNAAAPPASGGAKEPAGSGGDVPW